MLKEIIEFAAALHQSGSDAAVIKAKGLVKCDIKITEKGVLTLKITPTKKL
jgi:hypothetical protein